MLSQVRGFGLGDQTPHLPLPLSTRIRGLCTLHVPGTTPGPGLIHLCSQHSASTVLAKACGGREGQAAYRMLGSTLVLLGF